LSDQKKPLATSDLPAATSKVEVPSAPDPAPAPELDANPAFSAQPAPVRPQPLSANDTTPLSARMRELLGRPVYRDSLTQIEHEQQRGVLFRELRVGTLLQAKLVDRLAKLFIDVGRLDRTIETAVHRRRADAARDILMQHFSHFHPPPPGTLEANNMSITAYGEFLNNGGRQLIHTSDSEVIEEAIAALALQGLPAESLDERARILALEDIERLEKLIATKHAEAEALVEQLLRLIDRRERNLALKPQG